MRRNKVEGPVVPALTLARRRLHVFLLEQFVDIIVIGVIDSSDVFAGA
jgi:hypothetical protein